MEFKKHQFKLPDIEEWFREMGVGYIDPLEADAFEKQVSTTEWDERIIGLKKQKRLKSFMWAHGQELTIVLFFATMLAIIVHKHLLVILPLGSSTIISLVLTIKLSFAEYNEKGWTESPFSDFEGEYPGTIAVQVNPCLKTTHGDNQLVTLKVRSHSASRLRFLTVVDRDDPDGGYYYIDAWEKPETADLDRPVVPEVDLPYSVP